MVSRNTFPWEGSRAAPAITAMAAIVPQIAPAASGAQKTRQRGRRGGLGHRGSFNQQRMTATAYLRSFGDTVVEQYRMHDLKQAFEKVLDHPDAATALAHPALAPLLELAAD
jgi:hypothetical protein